MKKYVYFLFLIMFVCSGCQTIGRTFQGLGSGLQQDGKSTINFMSKCMDYFVENIW